MQEKLEPPDEDRVVVKRDVGRDWTESEWFRRWLELIRIARDPVPTRKRLANLRFSADA